MNKANNVNKIDMLHMGTGVCKNIFKVKTGKGKNSLRFVAGVNV